MKGSDTLDKTIEKIEQIRKERNIQKGVFAKNIGMSAMAYSRLSNGQSKLTVETLVSIAKYLKISDYNFFLNND